MVGQGLQHLLKSPMAGGQQFPDPTDIVKQLMEQFAQYVRARSSPGKLTSREIGERAPLAIGGGAGLGSGSGMPAIQPPIGTPPREKAGRMREAGIEGAGTFLQQAGETAAEPWKPKGLDIALLGASIALPIIAALQPEGRGRRGQRKQRRRSDLFKGLGEIAQRGLGMRMESFATGKEATYGAAKTRAEMSVKEAEAGYGHEIARIEAAEGKRRWEAERDLAERGMAVKERPGAEKPMFTPYQEYQIGRGAAADTRRMQTQNQKDTLIQANQITRSIFGMEFIINSVQDLDEAIYNLEQSKTVPFSPAKGRFGQTQAILQQLRNLRDQYYGGETPMLPMGGGQTGLGEELPFSGGFGPDGSFPTLREYEDAKRKGLVK